MIILSSQLAMRSQHQLTQHEEEHENLRYWSNGNNQVESRLAAAAIELRSDKVSIAFNQQQSEAIQNTATTKNLAEVEETASEEDIKQAWKLTLIRRIIEQLTGKQIKVVKVSDLTTDAPVPVDIPRQTQAPPPAPTEELAGWGLEYHYRQTYHESERTSFSAQGQILTADGREIAINIELSMSRSFSSQKSIDLRAGDALKDPLVINYAGTAAQLDETDLQFDLDLDGNTDQLHFVSAGSGFLALDKNADGQINDGNELFGPASGDGFAELASYDSDGNNWIDENDSIYSRLRIWERDAQGNYSLLALSQRGIGAIYLDRVETPFSLKDQQNNLQGEVRSSGLFLHETGQAGTVQQLDMVV